MARPKTTTKPVKKRGPYKKKAKEPDQTVSKWLYEGTKDIPDLSINNEISVKSENQYADIDCLAVFCDSFDKLDYESQVRVFAYINSRYSHLTPSQKID